jgi:tRNA threonylcarbamoyladenosine biosynthesis protein TsaE
MPEVHLRSCSAAGTEAFGRELAAALRGGDTVCLSGGLGAGKTTLVRGIVAGLGHPDPREVQSPTFALLHRYEGGRCPVHHLDLFRVEDPAALEAQGILDVLGDPEAIALVEWCERAPAAFEDAAWRLELEIVGEEEREIRGEVPVPLPGVPGSGP